jgi:hypothetical protein
MAEEEKSKIRGLWGNLGAAAVMFIIIFLAVKGGHLLRVWLLGAG